MFQLFQIVSCFCLFIQTSSSSSLIKDHMTDIPSVSDPDPTDVRAEEQRDFEFLWGTHKSGFDKAMEIKRQNNTDKVLSEWNKKEGDRLRRLIELKREETKKPVIQKTDEDRKSLFKQGAYVHEFMVKAKFKQSNELLSINEEEKEAANKKLIQAKQDNDKIIAAREEMIKAARNKKREDYLEKLTEEHTKKEEDRKKEEKRKELIRQREEEQKKRDREWVMKLLGRVP